MAFDFGTRQIGVAVGQTVTGTASALDTIKARDGIPDWQRIDALIDQWRPDLLLVGLPLNMDGSDSPMSQRARKFSRRLHGRYGLPAALMDERLSTFAAKGELLARGEAVEPGSGGRVDAIAAQLILESWMQSQTPGL